MESVRGISAQTARSAEADHQWRLRDVEFEDGSTTRCFECLECGAVRYD